MALIALLAFTPKAHSEPDVLLKDTRLLTDKEIVEAYFSDIPVLIEIARAESRFEPLARNPASTAKGIYQILDGTFIAYNCEGNVFNTMDNIKCARKIYEQDGTTPWNASAHVWK